MDDDVYKQLAAGSGRLIGRRAMLQAMLAAGATAAVMASGSTRDWPSHDRSWSRRIGAVVFGEDARAASGDRDD